MLIFFILKYLVHQMKHIHSQPNSACRLLVGHLCPICPYFHSEATPAKKRDWEIRQSLGHENGEDYPFWGIESDCRVSGR